MFQTDQNRPVLRAMKTPVLCDEGSSGPDDATPKYAPERIGRRQTA
jgi:hypothetical protein